MANITTNIREAYNTFFGSDFIVPKPLATPRKTTFLGSPLSQELLGREVLLPVTLWVDNSLYIDIACATVRVSSQRTVIRTPIAQRMGTVKELYGQDDWKFTIRGVLIDRWGNIPEEKIMLLKRIYESNRPVELRNAFTDFFLEDSKRVALLSLEFPEIEGKSIRMRSFVLQAESDYISNLYI